MTDARPAERRRRKIAFVIDTIACDTAGTQKQLLEILRRLDRERFEPQLICLWASPWMAENLLPCPCSVLGYRGFLKSNFAKVVRLFRAKIEREQIDLLMTFFEDSIFVTWLAALTSSRRPALLSSRRDLGLGAWRRPWYYALFRFALPVVNWFFDGIVANSQEVRLFVARRERVALDKIEVVYNGVYFPGSQDASTIPAVFTESPADMWVGLVASLTPVKRQDLLIHAVEILKSRGLQAILRVLLLGDGGERQRLEQLAVECGVADRIHFEGAVKDVGAYLRRLDVGVLCSDREGLSNAILEYMAYGLPVVATAVGGNTELVTAANGFCVAANDAEALADALGKLIANRELRLRMSAMSRERVRADFSWESSMARLERHLEAVLEGRGRR
jgi:L-malate glycosyltransferase